MPSINVLNMAVHLQQIYKVILNSIIFPNKGNMTPKAIPLPQQIEGDPKQWCPKIEKFDPNKKKMTLTVIP